MALALVSVMFLNEARKSTTSPFSFLIGTMSSRHQNSTAERKNTLINIIKHHIWSVSAPLAIISACVCFSVLGATVLLISELFVTPSTVRSHWGEAAPLNRLSRCSRDTARYEHATKVPSSGPQRNFLSALLRMCNSATVLICLCCLLYYYTRNHPIGGWLGSTIRASHLTKLNTLIKNAGSALGTQIMMTSATEFPFRG